MTDHPPSTAALVAEVFAAIGAIPKDSKAPDIVGGYAFRGIDAVQATLHPLFAERGLWVQPITVDYRESHHEIVRGSSSKLQRTVALCVQYWAVGPAGVEDRVLLGEVWGEAAATDDKATNQAYSSATKNMTWTTFMVPTEERTDSEAYDSHRDSDRENRIKANAAKQGVVILLGGGDGASDEAATEAKTKAREVWAEAEAVGVISPGSPSFTAAQYDGLVEFVKSRVDPFLPGEATEAPVVVDGAVVDVSTPDDMEAAHGAAEAGS